MATLVSPGVSVTITDESFFIPATAPTVPLIFIATAESKLQPDGVSPAIGTEEHDVIRTVTSLTQSTELYGVPRFLEDSSGNQHHGDARNEYGLFALNQYLGVGNLAYVLRANVNLNDDLDDLRALWDAKIADSVILMQNLTQEFINEFNVTNGYTPATPGTPGTQTVDLGGLAVGTATAYPAAIVGNIVTTTITIDGTAFPVTSGVAITGTETYNDMIAIAQSAIGAAGSIGIVGGNIVVTSATTGVTSSVAITDGGPLSAFFGDMNNFVAINAAVPGTASPYKQTITQTEFLSLADEAMVDLFDSYSFQSSEVTFKADWTGSPLAVFANGFLQPQTGDFFGLEGDSLLWVGSAPGSVVPTEWTATEAGQSIQSAADQYKYTQEFWNLTSLGANDAARRVAITTALQASINSNTDLRSENFEYNLILCPGYHEVVDEMLALASDIGGEAFVIGDTPMDLDPDGITNPATGWAVTTQRQNNISSSFANVAYYYPSALASNLDGTNVLVAASGVALRTMAVSDDSTFVWVAPAGLRRGVVSGITNVGYADGILGGPTTFVEVALNQGQRDALYQDTASGRINPIVFFPGQGFVVWGQKSSAAQPSAANRVNVDRLMSLIKRSLRKNTLSFVFEPNDQLTRDSLKAVVDSFLGDIVVKRGLYDFATICDETNNTPDRIDRNEMYIDVAVKPVKAAEFIFIPIRIVSTGAEI